jgi:hypothetical protein
MSQPIVTTNLSLVLPPDNSKNTPTGADIQALANAINSIDAQIIAGIQNLSWRYANDTGVANAYAIAISPAPALQNGLSLYFKAAHANTAASTLAVNGGAAKAITKNGTTALAGAEIALNQIVQVIYDGTQFQLISQ